MNYTEKLLQEILPGKILSVHVGLSRSAVLAETDRGICCGLAATLSNAEFNHRCRPSVRNAGHLHEMSSWELAGLIGSDSLTESSIGLAAINALLPKPCDELAELNAEDYLMANSAHKNVAMVGHFPFVKRLKEITKNLWVLELNPQDGDLPAESAPDVIPEADIVIITATTLINGSFEGLAELCRPDAFVVLLGPSTPMTPSLYAHGISILSGTTVDDPVSTMLLIGQGGALHQLRQAGCIRFVTMMKGK